MLMKKLLLSIVSAFLLFTLSAQITESFSDYTVGGKIAQQAQAMGRDYWTTWDLNPGGNQDGVIEEMPAGNKCLKATMVSSNNFNDNVLRLGDKNGTVWNPKTSGAWELTFKIYIPAGKDGYFNIKSVFPSSDPPTWAMQIYMGTDEGQPGPATPGVGKVYGGSTNGVNFSFAHDTWVPIKIFIDLDDDVAEFYVNETMIHTYQYSLGSFGESNHRYIAAFNIFPPNTAATSLFYVDDIVFAPISNVIFGTSFDDDPLGSPVTVHYPGWWTTWDSNPGGAMDGVISNEQAATQPHSAKMVYNKDIVFLAGDQTAGTYTFDFKMYIPNGVPVYFNLLHHFAGMESEWAAEVFFNITANSQGMPLGTNFKNNGINTPFTAPPSNTWFPVKITIDLDADQANIVVNGVDVATWQFSNTSNPGVGQRQLGAISYWGCLSNTVFYIDDFVFSGSGGDSHSIMNVTPNQMTEHAAPGSTQTITNPITVANTGTSMGDYYSWIEFDFEPTTGTNNYTVTYSSNDEGGGVGYATGTPLIEVAAKYPSSVYCDKMGTYITKVAYFMYQPVVNNTLTARVYGGGSFNSPGEILAQATITNAMSGNWNEITLSTPVLLNGQDIWVAFEFTQPAGGFPISYDDGAAIENSNWTRNDGGSWRQMFTVSDPPQGIGRYMIKAFTQGSVVPGCWLSIAGNTHGTVPKGTNKTFNAVFNPAGLAIGTYEATIYVATNDTDNPLFTIPCTFIIESAPVITVNPNSINEIVAGPGGTATVTMTVTNSGTEAGNYSVLPVTVNWITLSGNTSGTLQPGNSNTFEVIMTAADLEYGIYETTIEISTPGSGNGSITVPCKLQVGNSVGEYKIKTLIYPNPTNDRVTIESNVNINSIQLFNIMGQVIHFSHVNAAKTTMSTSNFGAGIYFLRVNTDHGPQSIKLIVK